VTRDQYSQGYRVDLNYASSEALSTGIALDVSRNHLINIASASTSSNYVLRSYRAEWRWTYRLFETLTATQRSSLSADYSDFDYQPEINRVVLDYSVVTTLNAIVTPRLTVNLTHNGKTSPSGNYTILEDGLPAFSTADESRNYGLSAGISYTPTPAFSLQFEPNYTASDRTSTLNGVEVPQRRSRSLNFSGGASLNIRVGGQGLLRGDIRRSYRADRSTTYTAGTPQITPLTETDYWNGSLQFSWRL
jgi:hypothetical protein